MPLNHYVTLGKSGLKVSPFCLGAMTFGQDWGAWGSTPEDSVAIIDRYLDGGGNFIDTANAYTRGHSEAILGDHLSKDKGKRRRTVLATKFFGCMEKGDPNAGGGGRKNIIWSCEESLRRLKTDYIDLYWLHCWDYHVPIEETLRAMDHLVSAGKVRYIGFSDVPAWKVAQAQMIANFRSWAPITALQIEYSLLERTVEGELMPMARELGIGVTPWSPLKGGALSGKYRRDNRGEIKPGRGPWVEGTLSQDKTYDVVDVLIAIAKEINSTPARVALNWVQRQPGVTSTIIGARTMSQLEDNLAALDIQLNEDQLKRLAEVSEPKLNFPHGFLKNSPRFRNPSVMVNGELADDNPIAPTPGEGW